MSHKIEYLVIHCSESNWGNANVIREWHTKERKWRDIGYHYVINNGHPDYKTQYNVNLDGLIEAGRPLDQDSIIDPYESGAHARGWNHKSIGICMIGRDKFTIKQFKSLYFLCKYWDLSIPDIQIIGHKDVPDSYKTCPNFEVEAVANLVKEKDDLTNITQYLLKNYEESIE